MPFGGGAWTRLTPHDRYRDLLLNVSLAREDAETAHVGELQLHIRRIMDLKELAHVSYGIARGIM